MELQVANDMLTEATSTAKAARSRVGAMLGIVGGLVSMAVAPLHPSESVSGPDFTPNHMHEMAESSIWVPAHLALALAALLTLFGLAAIADTITGSGQGWAGPAKLAAIATTGLSLATLAIDGFAMKRIAQVFAQAHPEPGSGLYLAAQGFEYLQLSLFSMVVLTSFGVTQLLFGIAVVCGGPFPRWLGAVAILFGLLGFGIGVVHLLDQLHSATITLFVVTWSVFTLWVVIMSVLVWRHTRRSDDPHAAGRPVGAAG